MFHFETISQFIHDLMSGGHHNHTGDAAIPADPADTTAALAASGIDISALSEADLHALMGEGVAQTGVVESASHAVSVSDGVRFGHWTGSGETWDGTHVDIYDY